VLADILRPPVGSHHAELAGNQGVAGTREAYVTCARGMTPGANKEHTMSKTETKKARKARRERRAKKAKLAVLIVNHLIARKPTAKELAAFKRQFVIAEVVPTKGGAK
jgi:hypothetical protein